MSYKNLRTSLMEIISSKKDKAKSIINKFKHHRNLSTSCPTLPKNISPKKIFSRKEKSYEKQPILSFFNIFEKQNSIEEISNFGTNKKPKISKDEKNEKDKEKIPKIKVIPPTPNNAEIKNQKYITKKEKGIKLKSKSDKSLLSKTPMKDLNIKNEKDSEGKKEVIYRKYCEIPAIPENFINLPDELHEQLKKPELIIISPNNNIEGNYSSYINSVAQTLKEFIVIDYDCIFDIKNKDNVKYLYYTTPINLEETRKKKLLLIALDETLIHSEFRNRNNYKELDLFTKKSKCNIKTFSYQDENYIYYMDVFFRPHLKHFLYEVSKYFDLAIFTAATKGYADTIIDYIDPNNKYFKFRLYRDACIPIQNRLYIKDLRIIKDYDPMNVILMDNSLYSFMNQPSNGMLVNSFYANHKDTQLITAKKFLINHIFPCYDIREECEKWYHFSKLFYKGTSKEIKED